MRVLHVFHELKYSGAEIMYVDAAPVFNSLGCDLSVVATATNLGEFAPKFEEAGYTVYHKTIPNKKSILNRVRYYIKFIKFIKSKRFDLVHNHSSATYWGMALCAKLAGVKCVYTFHNVFSTSWYSRWYHIWLRWSAKKLFNCTFQTISNSVYHNECSTFFNNTTLINNWYGSNRFYPANEGEKKAIRKEMDIDENALVLISVGGCSHIKRHSDIIKALPLIIEKYSNTIYLHLGEGDVLCEEEELAMELGVNKNIRFLGNQNNVRHFLIASDIYLMPSKFEGLPITTIENMGCAIPSILYDVPGLRDFNKESETAILIEEDVNVLAKQVILLHSDKSKQHQIIMNATQNVNILYNIKKNALDIFNLYH